MEDFPRFAEQSATSRFEDAPLRTCSIVYAEQFSCLRRPETPCADVTTSAYTVAPVASSYVVVVTQLGPSNARSNSNTVDRYRWVPGYAAPT